MAENRVQCVFDNLGECTALKIKVCGGCKFYKSNKEYSLNEYGYAVKKKGGKKK